MDQHQEAAPEAAQEAPAESVAATQEATAEQQTFDAEYVKSLRAEAAKYRTEAKANAEAAARLKAFEDAQKSEAERQAEALAEAQQRAAKAEAEALRLRIAAETELPADLHEFLSGDSEDELRAKAEKLKAATAAGVRRPQPDPSQGAKPNGTGPSQLTRADLARMNPAEIEQARVDGRLADVLAGTA